MSEGSLSNWDTGSDAFNALDLICDEKVGGRALGKIGFDKPVYNLKTIGMLKDI